MPDAIPRVPPDPWIFPAERICYFPPTEITAKLEKSCERSRNGQKWLLG